MQRKLKYLSRIAKNWRYFFFASKAKRPYANLLQQEIKQQGYFSQFGQDKWLIEEHFSKKNNGIFVDIGAYDGITFSNTYLLEQRGWQGIAIEPNPFAFDKLRRNRKCFTVQGCIGSSLGNANFRVVSGRAEMLSGLVDEYDSRHIERINREVNMYGGEYKDIDVECFTLPNILEKHGFSHIDYLNIDVEGAEFKILQSIDFSKVSISVFGVENNYKDWRIPYLLINNGFIFDAILGDDEFYIKKHV